MAKIAIYQNGLRSDEIDLRHGPVTIGRDADNDISVASSVVSARHAKIVTLMDVSYIEDLGSTNGTFVNGKRVEQHTLRHGDVVKIGDHALVFESEAHESVAGNSDETLVLSRDDINALLADTKNVASTANVIRARNRHAEEPLQIPRATEVAEEPSSSVMNEALVAGAQSAPVGSSDSRPVAARNRSTSLPNAAGLDTGAQPSPAPSAVPTQRQSVPRRPAQTGHSIGAQQAKVSRHREAVRSGTSAKPPLPSTASRPRHRPISSIAGDESLQEPLLPRWFVVASGAFVVAFVVLVIAMLVD